jgi:hypothetical protein
MLVTSPVRRAVPADEAELMEMCRKLWEENGLFTFSERKVRDILHSAWDGRGGIIGVIGDTGKLQGSICLTIGDYFYTDEFHVGELWNFVLPEHRRSTNAKELIRFAVRCSDEIGIRLVIGVISNERTAAKVALYERILGKQNGAFFIHHPARAGLKAAPQAVA